MENKTSAAVPMKTAELFFGGSLASSGGPGWFAFSAREDPPSLGAMAGQAARPTGEGFVISLLGFRRSGNNGGR